MPAAGVQVISTALGYVLPNIISKEATQRVATLLYVVFGVRLLWIAWNAKPQDSNQVRSSVAALAWPHAGQRKLFVRLGVEVMRVWPHKTSCLPLLACPLTLQTCLRCSALGCVCIQGCQLSTSALLT